MVIQTKNHNQLTGGISIIKYIQHMAPTTGMTEYLRIKLSTATMINTKTKIKYKNS